MIVELKPCPFCGQTPPIYQNQVTKMWIIRCTNEKCRIMPHTDYHKTKGVIVREWNRRAET